MNRIEDRLIVECARTTVDEQREESITRLFQQDIDWKYLNKNLIRNRVTLLFSHTINNISHLEGVAPRGLERRVGRIVKRNLRLKADLIGVLNIFDTHGISSVPVKGPLLAQGVYKNLALREFGDLDILVNDNDYDQAASLLQSTGYVQTDDTGGHGHAHASKSEHHHRFTHKETDTLVELHWELSERKRGVLQQSDLPHDALTTVDFEDMSIKSLSQEFLLLYLCLHGYRHQWERLSWLCDIAELINDRPLMDWAKVYQYAEQFHLTRVLFMGLYLAQNVLECKLPEAARDGMSDSPMIRVLGKHVVKNLFSDASAGPPPKHGRYDYFVFNFLLLTHPMHRARYLGVMLNLLSRKLKWTPS